MSYTDPVTGKVTDKGSHITENKPGRGPEFYWPDYPSAGAVKRRGLPGSDFDPQRGISSPGGGGWDGGMGGDMWGFLRQLLGFGGGYGRNPFGGGRQGGGMPPWMGGGSGGYGRDPWGNMQDPRRGGGRGGFRDGYVYDEGGNITGGGFMDPLRGKGGSKGEPPWAKYGNPNSGGQPPRPGMKWGYHGMPGGEPGWYDPNELEAV